MSDIVVKANSEDVGLRRESTLDVGALPLWLARLHRALPVDATVRVTMRGDLPVAKDVLIEGAGFSTDADKLVRERTLPDMLSPGLRAVMVGLNPSVRSADAGYGFAGPGNRFWDAAVEAGLLTEVRKPEQAMIHESVGFTDLVKRATARANEISAAEYRSGLVRLNLALGWIAPKIVIVAGLTGWRHATGEKRAAGWQPSTLGGRPVYLMPNPSGLNASTSLDDLVAHLRTALQGPPSAH
ncbi:MAG: mismatch-specific DNA-glycosylase [Acidimicrobiales bacterium]